MGKKPAEVFISAIQDVGLPLADPVYGIDGPLSQLWHQNLLAKL